MAISRSSRILFAAGSYWGLFKADDEASYIHPPIDSSDQSATIIAQRRPGKNTWRGFLARTLSDWARIGCSALHGDLPYSSFHRQAISRHSALGLIWRLLGNIKRPAFGWGWRIARPYSVFRCDLIPPETEQFGRGELRSIPRPTEYLPYCFR